MKKNTLLIELRFAESGHSHLIEAPENVDCLQQQIWKQYKIQINDQRLISKNGYIFKPMDKFNDSDQLHKTYFKEGNEAQKMSEANGIYLFNHRMLYKDTSESQIVEDEEYLENLEKKCKPMLQLREKTYELQPLENIYKKEKLQQLNKLNPKILQIVHSWNKRIREFGEKSSRYKQIKCCFDNSLDLNENQRKAIKLLKKIIEESESYRRHKKLKPIIEKTQPHKLNKQISEMRSEIKKKNYEALKNAIKQAKELRELERKFLKELQTIGNQLPEDKCKIIQNTYRNFKEDFATFKENFIKEYLEQGKFDNVKEFLENYGVKQKKLSQELAQVDEEIEKGKQAYCKLMKISKALEKAVIEGYRCFCKYTEFSSKVQITKEDIVRFQKTVEEFIKNFKMFEKQQEVMKIKETQIQHRSQFLRIIYTYQEKIKNLIKQEQERRKLFLQQWTPFGQSDAKLQNTNVLCVLINFDETSDLDLLEYRKLQLEGAKMKEFMGMQGAELMIKELEQVRNLQASTKKTDETSARIRSLEEIIEKSSNIFYQAYNHKLKVKTRELSQQIQNQKDENKSLREQIQIFKEQVEIERNKKNEENEIVKNHEQVEQNFHRLELTIEQLTNENNKLNKKLDEALQSVREAESKRKRERWENDTEKQELKGKILYQIQLTEQLINELNNQKQQNISITDKADQYKVIMGDQAVQIAKLSSELEKIEKNKEKDESQDEAYVNPEIQKLTEEIEILKEENQNLNEELLKIAMLETEDCDVQTDFIEEIIPNKNTLQIKSQVEKGQRRIFIPYNKGVYACVNLPSEDGTKWGSENMGNSNNFSTSPYLLSSKNYSQKVKELLRQCSLIVIVKVLDILQGVEQQEVIGEIEHIMGFEEETMSPCLRDYVHFIE